MFINYLLNEKGLILNNQAYPKFNNVLIAAGGAGSGKGYVLSEILLFQGKTFDVDEIKKKIANSKENSKISKDFREFLKSQNTDVKSVSDIDFGNPNHVELVHNFNKNAKYDVKLQNNLVKSTIDRVKQIIVNSKENSKIAKDFKEFLKSQNTNIKSISNIDLKNNNHNKLLYKFIKEYNLMSLNDHLPNLIFDVTLKDLSKLNDIHNIITEMGYQPKNTHLVWILNSIEVAKEQNANRVRKVSPDILTRSHNGASQTLREIIRNSNKYRNIIDGDIWIVPNQVKVDNEMVYGNQTPTKFANTITSKIQNPHYITEYRKFKIKSAGKECKSEEALTKEILTKIIEYVPDSEKDKWKSLL